MKVSTNAIGLAVSGLAVLLTVLTGTIMFRQSRADAAKVQREKDRAQLQSALIAQAAELAAEREVQVPQEPSIKSLSRNDIAAWREDLSSVGVKYDAMRESVLDAEIRVSVCRDHLTGFDRLRSCLLGAAASAETAGKKLPRENIATTDCGKAVEAGYRNYIQTVPKMFRARVEWLDLNQPSLSGGSLWDTAERGILDLDWPNDSGRAVIKDRKTVHATSLGIDGDDVLPHYRSYGYKKFRGADRERMSPQCLNRLPECQKRLRLRRRLGTRRCSGQDFIRRHPPEPVQ